jgi:hypothetical protein
MYDSTKDTQKHIDEVIKQGTKFALKLQKQIQKHDASKLKSPEKDGFDKYTPMLAKMEYNSPEYKKCLAELKDPYLNHHYANNSHHPEHFENGIDGMNLYDLIEMLCDWKAAVKRNKNGNIYKSLEINKSRFKISNQLYNILLNTIKCDDNGSVQVMAMAYEKKEEIQRIKSQTKSIVSWWCLLDYFKKYEDINNLTQHEQGKLAGLLHNLAADKVKDSNSKEVKLKILNDYWKEKLELDKDERNVVNVFWDKFNKEKIKREYNKLDDVARDFVKDIDVVINLISSGTRESIDTYLNNNFGV